MTRPKRHLCVIGDSDTISKYVYPSRLPSFIPSLVPFSTHARRTRHPCAKRGKPAEAKIVFGCDACDGAHETRAGHGVTHSPWHPSRTASWDTVAQHAANVDSRGSKFLKSWMDFLEEHADLRYPNLADVYVDEQDG
jgi:hypothetical protein